MSFYRPQQSCEGSVSTPVCDSVHMGGGSASVHAGILPPRRRHPSCSRHTPPQQTPHGAGTPSGADTPVDDYCCGRYTSYWNAFLCLFCFFKKRKFVVWNTCYMLSLVHEHFTKQCVVSNVKLTILMSQLSVNAAVE